MNVRHLDIPEVLLFEPKVFGDERGCFFESFNKRQFEEVIGQSINFVQDNHSISALGVVRGLHYQLPPYEQGKLVRVVSGEIFDVAVDIRQSSPTLGRWVCVNLSAENRRMLWIPPGFAHGFMALTNNAEVVYKVTEFYEPKAERTILWSDSELNISWPTHCKPVLSFKDKSGEDFSMTAKLP